MTRIQRLRRGILGINRRNHGYLFPYNARRRYALADDKLATKALLDRAGIPVPLLHAACTGHWEIARIGRLLDTLPGFVLKPARGAAGAGIVVVTGHDVNGWQLANGHHTDWATLSTHIADVLAGVYASTGLEDRLLVEALVQADATLGALAYRGVPDLRVLVFRGLPLMAMLRLPTRASGGRANLHLGAIGVGVDLARGITIRAIHGGGPIARHPDVGVELRGVVIPGWDAVLDIAVRAADATGLGFLGVDVVLDAERGPLVLELNARPGLAIQVANGRGLRTVLEAAAALAVPSSVPERIACGRRLAAGGPT